MTFFTDLQKYPKINMETQKTPNKAIFIKKNKAGDITIPDFKILQSCSSPKSMIVA
jgi:hypothetical protein